MSVSDLTLEKFLTGGLAPVQQAELEARLARDPELARRLEILRDSNRDILEQYPVRQMGARIRARHQAQASGQPAWRGPLLAAAPALAAAALILVLVAPRLELPFGNPDRIKGHSARVLVYRKTSAGVDLLANHAAARAGDLLRLGYVAGRAAHGVLLSVDGRGNVTLHFPERPGGSTALSGGGQNGQVLLSTSYELDDAPDFERFFLITSARPIAVPGVLAAARGLARNPAAAATGSLALDRSLRQTALTIHKGGAK